MQKLPNFVQICPELINVDDRMQFPMFARFGDDACQK